MTDSTPTREEREEAAKLVVGWEKATVNSFHGDVRAMFTRDIARALAARRPTLPHCSVCHTAHGLEVACGGTPSECRCSCNPYCGCTCHRPVLTEADAEAVLRAVPTICRLCQRGFPRYEATTGYKWHYGSQARGMIPDTMCSDHDPDYAAMARAVLALGGKTKR